MYNESNMEDLKGLMYKCLFFLMYVLPVCAMAQVGTEQVRNVPAHVALFQGDRVAAMTYSFDDGTADQLALAVPMLDKYGFKATFFVIAGLVPENEAQLATMKPSSWERLPGHS
jgi:peptidoglycan/xylan/chitin deacetylase (PgdA/CDA1 family)